MIGAPVEGEQASLQAEEAKENEPGSVVDLAEARHHELLWVKTTRPKQPP